MPGSHELDPSTKGAICFRKALAVIKLGRPFVLVAGIIAYALGLSMAYHDIGMIEWPLAWLGLIILIIATLMAHYANEYADVDTDSVTRRTFFSGGSGVLPSGIVPARWALYMAYACMAFAALLTLASILLGILDMAVGFIVLAGMAGGWFYSMPPLRLERTWMGEIDNSLLGGFLMPLIAYACLAGTPPADAWIRCVPIFLIVLANLLEVHWADRLADEAVGKNSLVVRLGGRTRTLHSATMILTYALIIAMAGTFYPIEVVALALLSVPLAFASVMRFGKGDFHGTSSLTMGLLMILMAAGWIMAGV